MRFLFFLLMLRLLLRGFLFFLLMLSLLT